MFFIVTEQGCVPFSENAALLQTLEQQQQQQDRNCNCLHMAFSADQPAQWLEFKRIWVHWERPQFVAASRPISALLHPDLLMWHQWVFRAIAQILQKLSSSLSVKRERKENRLIARLPIKVGVFPRDLLSIFSLAHHSRPAIKTGQGFWTQQEWFSC